MAHASAAGSVFKLSQEIHDYDVIIKILPLSSLVLVIFFIFIQNIILSPQPNYFFYSYNKDIKNRNLYNTDIQQLHTCYLSVLNIAIIDSNSIRYTQIYNI